MKLRVGLGLTISVVLLFLAARNVDPSELLPLIKNVNLFYLAASTLFSLLAVWVRAWRWRYLIPKPAEVNTYNLFVATMIGYMGNNVLPLRVGDLARIYIAARQARASATAFLATVVVERLLDVFSIVLILGVLVFLIPVPGWVSRGSLILLGISLLAWAMLLFVKAKKSFVRPWIERIFVFRRTQRLINLSHAFFDGLKGMEAGKEFIAVSVLTIPLWVNYALATYLALKAVHLDLPVSASWAVLSFVGIGVSLPSAPGFIGTFQFFTVAALALFAVEEKKAFGFSLIFHASQYVPITLYGWLLLLKRHMSFSDLASFQKPTAD